MKIRFPNRTYTFLILPESGKAAIRLRIPLILLISLPLMIMILAGAVYYLNQVNQHNLAILSNMEEALQLKESELEETIISKNITIKKLHNDILNLSQHAEEVREKIEELKQLEAELRSITGDNQTDTRRIAATDAELVNDSFKPVHIAALSSNPSVDTDYMGGLLYPSSTRIDQLVHFTEYHYNWLEDEMAALYSSLIDAKDEVLAYQHSQRITPTIWPTDSRRISSQFGNRRDPFTRRTSFHSGIDIAGRSGSQVYATADGTIKSVGYDRYKGNYIIINHTQGIQTAYMHLSKVQVKKGQTVEKGQVIGNMGSTGRSTGPHLHYEVIKNGKPVDPKPYMQTSREG